MKILKIILPITFVILISCGLLINSQRNFIVEKSLSSVQQSLSENFDVPIYIGDVDCDKINFFGYESLSEITVHNVEIFDKKNEQIANIDEAKINFKLFKLTDDPAAAIDTIKINGVTLNLTQREDESWNVNDIDLEGEGESTFAAKIFWNHGTINTTFDGKNIAFEDLVGTADFADKNIIDMESSATVLGANVTANSKIGSTQQVINATLNEIDFVKLLPFLPQKDIPDGVTILGGKAENFSIHILRNDNILSYIGETKISDASVLVEKTNVEAINGSIKFNERELNIDGVASANDQHVSTHGKILLDTDEIFFDIQAESDNFTPSAIINDIGIQGSAKINAHLTGTSNDPIIEADISSPWLAYEDVSANNIVTKLRYAEDTLYLDDTMADLFGGKIIGSFEVTTDDLNYIAHIKANDIDALEFCTFANIDIINIDGRLLAEVDVNGNVDDFDAAKIFGHLDGNNISLSGLLVDKFNSSFYLQDDNLKLDYLSASLSDNGTLNLEGNISLKNNTIDNFYFYGSSVELSQIKYLNPQLDMAGFADFTGTINGNLLNPIVSIQLNAIDLEGRGQFFNQPFDSLTLVAAGNLDDVKIDKLTLEKDGAIKWTAIEGSIGLIGEENINIFLDAKDIRAEDILKIIALDQPITGNVNNTVKITGTLEDMKLSGNIKLNRGSYHGILINDMNGDYFLDGDIVRLQDFEITSPYIDIVLNGTFDNSNDVMNFVVQGKDINLERLQSRLPADYTSKGHAIFEGVITGTPAIPRFDGTLQADELYLNNVKLTNILGHILLNGSYLYLDEFHFNDGAGSYQSQITANLANQMMSGEVDVTNANIEHLLALSNQNSKLINGTLDCKILLNGSLDQLRGSVTGNIIKGTCAGYDIHDINIAVNLLDNTIYFNKLQGSQGTDGYFDLHGSANIAGALDLQLNAKEIELGLLAKAAGSDLDMVGTTNINAKLGGTISNPSGELFCNATGGIRGSTFDLLSGHFLLKDWRVNVEELSVQRKLLDKNYGVKMNGYIPLRALTAQSIENLPNDEQLNLTIALDGANLTLLPILSKEVSWGIGDLDGELNITGVAVRPKINGQISLRDASIKLKGMDTLIDNLNISTVFKGERFDIENFTANIGGGLLNISGGFSFPNLEIKDYNFDLIADNIDIDSDFYDGKLDAKFNLSEKKTPRRTLPKLSGEINVDKCRVSIPSLPDSEDSLPDIILDVKLHFGDKVHFYSSRLYDLYFTGDANFSGTTNLPKTSGIITVKRGGTLTYLETVFNIKEGEAYFNQVGTFMPSLHLLAETKIDRTKIFINVDGSPDNFKLKFTSNPEMPETEIFRLLTLREAYSKGEGKLTTADALAIGLQMTVLASIEGTIKQTLGIDQLTVSRGTGSIFKTNRMGNEDNEYKSGYNIKIAKQVSDKLAINYTHGFGTHHLNRYGLQYECDNNFGFNIDRENKEYIFAIEARYKF